MPAVNALIRRLEDGLPADPGQDSADQAERRLLAHLLLYHRRESKPEWWRHFELADMTLVELEYERDALSGLIRMNDVEPVPYKRSLDYAFTFPPQEFKLDLGKVLDQQTGETHTIVAIEDDCIYLRRGKDAPPPAPAALIPPKPIDGGPLRSALVALATELADGRNPSPAARSILRREPPELRSGRLAPDADSLISATIGLVESNLPVQGPPGTGKTFLGARMVVAAMMAGMRVGVTAFSHAAIQNFLDMIEEHASEIGFEFQGMYKGHGYASRFGLIDSCDENKEADGDFELVAGTAWLFCRPEHRGRFGRLFIDEAGQFSLANAIAVAPAAESIVMLGDPQQLPQVTKADHPEGSGASVLEHLLDGHSTISAGRGVLLDESWRMHPEVCAFVSERSYDGLLRSRAACAHRRIDAPGSLSGAGLRVRFVDHDGRSQASVEEAEVIAEHCRTMLTGGIVTDAEGVARELTADDIVVVAPYNLARRCIAERVPTGVRVGTVDKFQGQEAPVVFFAMTCSSGEDVPRGLDFLFDRNRFNVAVSRAQCLAVVVVNPRLLGRRLPDSSGDAARRRGVPIRGDGCSAPGARSSPAQRPLTAAYVSITRLEAGCSPSCLTICRASPSSNGTSARRSVALHARGFANVFGRSATMGASSMPSPRGARASKTRSTPIGNSRSPNRIGSGRSLAGRLTVATPMTRPRSRVGFRKHPRVAYRRSRSPRASRSASRRR